MAEPIGEPIGGSVGEPTIKRLAVGPYNSNCYVVVCPATAEAVIIDPAGNPELIISALLPVKPRGILLTHGHPGHSGALRALRSAFRVPVGMHQLDAGLAQSNPDVLLQGGERIPLGQLVICVVSTPGHTPGSLTYIIEQQAFVGDLIFPGGPGLTSTPEEFRQILHSITRQILTLPPETTLHPGHGQPFLVEQAREEVADFLRRPAKAHLYGEVRWESS